MVLGRKHLLVQRGWEGPSDLTYIQILTGSPTPGLLWPFFNHPSWTMKGFPGGRGLFKTANQTRTGNNWIFIQKEKQGPFSLEYLIHSLDPRRMHRENSLRMTLASKQDSPLCAGFCLPPREAQRALFKAASLRLLLQGEGFIISDLRLNGENF